MLEGIKLIARMRDQPALQAQIANCMLQLGFGGFQVAFGQGHVAFHVCHVCLDAADHGAHRSLLLDQTRFSRRLRTAQFSRTSVQLLFRHSHLRSQGLTVSFHLGIQLIHLLLLLLLKSCLLRLQEADLVVQAIEEEAGNSYIQRSHPQ